MAAIGVTAPGVGKQSSAAQILHHSEQDRRHHFALIPQVCPICEVFWPCVKNDIGELEEMQKGKWSN